MVWYGMVWEYIGCGRVRRGGAVWGAVDWWGGERLGVTWSALVAAKSRVRSFQTTEKHSQS